MEPADFELIFQASPDPKLVLSPGLRIVAANDAYLRATLTRQADILGQHVFEVFPDNPAVAGATGVRNLRASLERVMSTRRHDSMPVQRYDIKRPPELGSGFEERWWSVVNAPAIDEQGRLCYLIHRVEDVTEFVRLGLSEPSSRTMGQGADSPAPEVVVFGRNLELQEALQRLRESEEKYRTLFTSMTEGFAMGELIFDEQGWAIDGRFLEANDAFFQQTGVPREIVGRPSREFLPEIEREWTAACVRAVLTGEPRRVESYNADTRRYYDFYAFRHSAGRFALLIRDTTEWQLAQERLRASEAAVRESERFLRQILDSVPGMAWTTDPDGGVDFISAQWLEYTGTDLESQLGSGWTDAIHPEDRPRVISGWKAAMRVNVPFDLEYRLRRHDGVYRWFNDRGVPIRSAEGGVVRWFGMCVDVHDRKCAQEALQHAALHDPLTNLPNRALFQARLQDALQRAQRHHEGVAAMFVDLDHFKPINDSLGHEAGDVALQTVAQRLTSLVRRTDTVARLGGDEFAVLLEDLKETEEAARVAQAVVEAIQQPISLAGQEVLMSASVGISCYPQDGDQPGALLKNADAAMYRAKQESRAAYRFFAPEMNEQTEQRFFLANHLRRVVAREELRLDYQPRVNLQTGRTVGVEALVRWQSPEHGLVLPARFIELAEDIGMSEPIGEWVLRKACTQYMAWLSHAIAPQFISVNVSPRQFSQPHLVERVRGVLAETGMPPAALELELTESVLMQDPIRACDTLAALNAMGIRMSLDDFGTGCSGLAYLKRFPISHLKIDRSFVQDVPKDPEDVAIIRAIVALAMSLELGLTAEGVETTAQLDFLAEEGCEVGQGFLFSVPLAAEGMEDLLARQQAGWRHAQPFHPGAA